MKKTKKKTWIKVVSFMGALLCLLTALIVPISARVADGDQYGWAAFNYNYANLSLGFPEFKDYWNKARDELPLNVQYATGRAGTTSDKMNYNHLCKLIGGDLVTLATKTPTRVSYYLGHGNGFVGATSTRQVSSEYFMMGHLYLQIEFYQLTDVLYNARVSLGLYCGGVNEIPDIWEPLCDYTRLAKSYVYNAYENILVKETFYEEKQFSGEFTERALIYDADTTPESQADYYGYMFGVTTGSINNTNDTVSMANILWYGWFNGPFGLDEETNGMDGKRFGVISPIIYLDGYRTGSDMGYEHGRQDGLELGYNNGYQQGEVDGYYNGSQDGYREGEKYGWDNGFGAGQDDMAKTSSTFKDVVFAIFDAPTRLIDGMLNFDIFGINLAGLVKTLLTLAVVAVILVVLIKMVKG